MISSDDNLDVKDMPGLTKKQVLDAFELPVVKPEVQDLSTSSCYGKYPQNESLCRTIQKWLAKDPSFTIYSVTSPTLLPNGHLYDSAELFNSHSSDIKMSSYTPLPNVETYSNVEWNINHHSKEDTQVEGSVKSDSKESTKSTSLEVKSACSKP